MWAKLQPFEAKTLAAGASETSLAVVLQDRLNEHAIEYVLTGDGTCDIEVFTSISGENFVSNGVKASGVGKTSGPGSDGKDILPLSLKPGDLIRVKVTETSTTDSIIVTLYFVQK